MHLKIYLKHFSFLEELSEILLKMYIGLHVKYWLFLLDFMSTGFSKNNQISNFMKIRLMGAELLRADGRS